MKKDIDDYELQEARSSLGLIANQARNLQEPRTLDEARSNLLALGQLVKQSLRLLPGEEKGYSPFEDSVEDHESFA